MTFKPIVLFVLAASCLVARAADEVREALGVGDTYREAINVALASALEQYCGVIVTSEEAASFAAKTAVAESSANGRNSNRELDDAIRRGLKKFADGRINGYDVVSEGVDPTSGKYRVVLNVRFPKKYVKGLDPDSRRRMVVANFRAANGDTFSWHGRNESTAMWSSTVSDKLNERFTQTRKFTMIDRKFDTEVQDEIRRLSDKNAARGDLVRLGQRLGTDYMVVGDVRFGSVQSPGVNPITGQALPTVSQRFAEISYRVILAPTGQLKWADTVTIDSGDVSAADMVSFVSASADLAARRIVDVVMANLLPLEIVGRNGAGEIIIGEGGKSLVAGERLTAFVLGEEVKDSRTGEVLDQVEEPVATLEIVRVTPKLSYARVAEGDASRVVAGTRARRPEVVRVPPQAPATASPNDTSIRATGTGGIVTPF